jgi:hypothetical protein
MTELDLIPSDYRGALRRKRWVTIFLCVYGGAVVLTVLAKLGLSVRVASLEEGVTELRTVKKQRARLDELRVRKEEAEKRLALLDGLRGGVSAEQVMLVLDRALEPAVWFKQLTFRRDGMVVPHPPEALESGYAMLIPQQGQQSREAWSISTRVAIQGQARDHAALSRFIKRLTEQAEVQEARLLNSGPRRHVSAEAVDFNLEVVINNRPVKGS